MRNHRQAGFTLIEIMIAVVVIAILVAIAYPSYLEHVKTTRRGEAKAALLELSQFMERKFTADGCYKCGTETVTLPLTQVPRDGDTKYYDLRLASSPAVSSASYTLEAAPTGAMSGDSCGTFKLDQTGTKTAGASNCW